MFLLPVMHSSPSSLKSIWPLVLTAIAGTFLFAWIAFTVLEKTLPSPALSIWNQWDTKHFLYLAQTGYQPADRNKVVMVIFPLYPLLIHLLGSFLKNPLLAGLLISNISYAISVFIFYKLVRLDQDEAIASKAIFYFSIYPTAYFLHAAYTESLFLLLTLSAFYCARQKRWACASILAMLASATRVTGILAGISLAVEYFAQKDFRFKNIKKDALWLALIPLGLLVFLAINYYVSGDFLNFLALQKKYWGKSLVFPWQGFMAAWKSFAFRNAEEKMMVCGMEVLFGLLGYLLAGFAFLRLRPSYAAYILLTWLAATSTAFWLSLPRYSLGLFPAFILLAIAGERRKWHEPITFISLLFYGLFLTQFVRGRWAF